MNKKIMIFSILLVCALSFSVFAKKNNDTEATNEDYSDVRTAVQSQGTALATLTNQINEIVTKFQEVSGETGRNFNKIREQDKIIKDVDSRLQVIEDKISILAGQIQELITEGLVAQQSTKRFEEYKNYVRAVEYINAKDFQKAITEFEKFNSENKDSLFSSYAQYWIGEAYYMQSDYPMAIKQYQKLLSSNPKSAKAPTALYRQGLSFFHLNSFDEAKAFFTKVIRTYPQSIEAVQSSSQINRINNIQQLQKQSDWESKMVQ